MDATPTITFVIAKKTPNDFTLDRIARYLRALSDLTGPAGGKVRLESVKKGSVRIAMRSEPAYYQEMVTRVTSSRHKDAGATIRNANATLQQLAEEDHIDASIISSTGAKLIQFHGYRKTVAASVKTAREHHQVRGKLIGLEGKDATKHARIAEFATGREVAGEIREVDIARELKAFLFEDRVVEFSGPATLTRQENGSWTPTSFRIEAYRMLDSAKPSSVFQSVREAFDKHGERIPSANDVAALRR